MENKELKNTDLNIDLNEEFCRALDLIKKTAQHVFITGKAGTGKSTFLQYYRQQCKNNLVVLAPTGVAAVNIQGQTIHSFFNFKPDITVENVHTVEVDPKTAKVYKRLNTIIVDEISMVRADLLDCMDAFLRLYGPQDYLPFGGVRLIIIGDLYQLAPVVRNDEKDLFRTVYSSPYFFDARVFKNIDIEFVEFEKNYRQNDESFIDVLNKIRTSTIQQKEIDILNDRCITDVIPHCDQFSVYLTTTNKLADKINYERIHELNEELLTYEGSLTGDFDVKSLPTHPILELKVGAQVILLNNDQAGRWINGSIGKIIDIFEAGINNPVVQVELSHGKRIEVEPFTWEIFHFYYNEDKDAIDSQVIGSFRQFPLKLAWALTIHKSQGKTFDQVILDIGRGAFCHGQIYVALSRCRTLQGIFLKRPLSRRDIFTDRRITHFLTHFQYKKADDLLPLDKKKRIIETAISEEQTLEILYLKEDCDKRWRQIVPKLLRKIDYSGESCWGVEALCLQRDTNWIFRLNCIIDIKPISIPQNVP